MRARESTKEMIESWLCAALPIVGLGHWKVTVSEEAAAEDAWADVEAHSVDPMATLRIGSGFDLQTPEKQRLILAHEMCHLFITPLDRYTGHLEEQHGRIWWAAWSPGYDDHTEQVTDAIAHAIAPRLPIYPLNSKTGTIERR